MTYITHFSVARLRHAHERPALCALEAAAFAARQALRLRFPQTLGRLDAPPPTHSRILAIILIERLEELLGTIDLYEQELACEEGRINRSPR